MLSTDISVQRAKVYIELVGLIGLAIGAAFTYLTYRQSAELQGLRAVNEAKLSVCQTLVDTTSKFYSAETPSDLRKLYYTFSEIKHGKGLTLLDAAVLQQAVQVHNATVNALQLPEGHDFRSRSRCVLRDEPLKLALSCRSMLAEALRTEASLPLPPIDPKFVMGWTLDCDAK